MVKAILQWTFSRSCVQLLVSPTRSLARQRHALIRNSEITKRSSGYFSLHRRFFSTRQNKGPPLYGLPFSVSPEQALDKFLKWSEEEQGLSPTWTGVHRRSVTLTAAYCPVWCWDVNMRFVQTDPQTGRKRFDWKPALFQVYGQQSVVHLPGLSTYAGYSYPRSLLNPLHNTSLVFLEKDLMPFGNWMLKPMELKQPTQQSSSSFFSTANDDDTTMEIPITPDPWNATKGRAWHILKQELTGIAQAGGPIGNNNGNHPDPDTISIQTELVRARRVMMPTYVLEYKLLGNTFQAFCSGADAGAEISGTSHQLWDQQYSPTQQQASQGLQGFLTQALRAVQTSAQTVGSQRTLAILAVVGRVMGQFAGRILLRLPWIAAAVGGFVGIRKFLMPLIASRWASAEWERQRAHEQTYAEGIEDDFMDPGTAQRYFQANKSRILSHLQGEEHHEQGNYDFYQDWTDWARRIFEQQQQQEQQYYDYSRNQQQQQRQRVYGEQQSRTSTNKKTTNEYQWDFDPQDPYAVLGIPRGSTKQQVSAAFRREMLKYHPDASAGQQLSAAQEKRNTERSKLISEAYRKIKAEMK